MKPQDMINLASRVLSDHNIDDRFTNRYAFELGYNTRKECEDEQNIRDKTYSALNRDGSKKEIRHEFWMVFAEGYSSPTVKHWDRGEAEVEALRLAKKLGDDVFILYAGDYVRETPPVTPLVQWYTTVRKGRL